MISSDALASKGSERATTRKEQWYVETRAGIMPMTSDAIEESLQRGSLQASTKIWKSGMQAWQPLGVVACFSPQPSSQQSARAPVRELPVPEAAVHDGALHDGSLHDRSLHDTALHDDPLPGLERLNWGPASEAPTPAPVHTLIRPIAYDRRDARAQSKAPQPPREQGSARGLRTWHSVLFSAVAGSALGLAVYHPQLWHASPQPVSPIAEQTPQLAAATHTATVPLAVVPEAAPPKPIETHAENAPSALVAPESALPTPQAKRSSARRSKLARRKLQRPGRTELPAWP